MVQNLLGMKTFNKSNDDVSRVSFCVHIIFYQELRNLATKIEMLSINIIKNNKSAKNFLKTCKNKIKYIA